MIRVCLLFTLAAAAAAQVVPSDATLEFENPLVRVVRVRYRPHQKTAMHNHPATPTVFVYVTAGGRLRIGHEGEETTIRPAVKAGAIRFQHAVAERHTVDELDGVASEYLQIELKAQPPDRPAADVRRAPDDRTPYESPTLRIYRVTCPAHAACPLSAHPQDAALVVTGREFRWEPAGTPPPMNSSGSPWEQVRVEIVAPAKP
jgi:quercetin dioxygenase-like cupin family protein